MQGKCLLDYHPVKVGCYMVHASGDNTTRVVVWPKCGDVIIPAS